VNGHVYITVPAFNFLWSKEDIDAGHFKRYSKKEIETVLVNANFEIKFSTYIFSILPIAVFIFRTLPYKIGLTKKSISLTEHKKDHQTKNGIFDSILNTIWNFELIRIKKGISFPFGGSCLVVAIKNKPSHLK